MKANLLDALIQFFQDCVGTKAAPSLLDFEQFLQDLEDAGINFELTHEPGAEFSTDLEPMPEVIAPNQPSANAFRILSMDEQHKLDKTCYSFLLFLEHAKLIGPLSREKILQEVMDSPHEQLDMDDLKAIIMSHLSDETDHPLYLAWLEYILFREKQETILH